MPDMPAIAEEVDLDATITNPTTALATARTTTEIMTWRVPVMRVMEKVPKIVVSCRWHEEDPRAQVSVITVGSIPRVSPPRFHEGLVKDRPDTVREAGSAPSDRL
jgi:hypothetical protein